MSFQSDLDALQMRIGHSFQDEDLLIRALTHSSYGDGRRKNHHNERLEFLGDRVLGLLTAEMLYLESNDKEGKMARRLNALVRKETCASVARELGLADLVQMSRAEKKQGGTERKSTLGDACEALLGALYLDAGLDVARSFFRQEWEPHIKRIVGESGKDAKTELQERVSQVGRDNPEYVVVDRSGPDHKPRFVIEVRVDGVGTAQGTGTSKKTAERQAARHLLESMNSHDR